MNIFHRHKFDPEKWKELALIPLTNGGTLVGRIWIFTNECTECGMLVEKKISSE